ALFRRAAVLHLGVGVSTERATHGSFPAVGARRRSGTSYHVLWISPPVPASACASPTGWPNFRAWTRHDRPERRPLPRPVRDRRPLGPAGAAGAPARAVFVCRAAAGH